MPAVSAAAGQRVPMRLSSPGRGGRGRTLGEFKPPLRYTPLPGGERGLPTRERGLPAWGRDLPAWGRGPPTGGKSIPGGERGPPRRERGLPGRGKGSPSGGSGSPELARELAARRTRRRSTWHLPPRLVPLPRPKGQNWASQLPGTKGPLMKAPPPRGGWGWLDCPPGAKAPG